MVRVVFPLHGSSTAGPWERRIEISSLDPRPLALSDEQLTALKSALLLVALHARTPNNSLIRPRAVLAIAVQNLASHETLVSTLPREPRDKLIGRP